MGRAVHIFGVLRTESVVWIRPFPGEVEGVLGQIPEDVILVEERGKSLGGEDSEGA